MSDDTRPAWEKAEEQELRLELMRVELELKRAGLEAWLSPEEAAYRAASYELQRLKLEDDSAEWREEWRGIIRRNADINERTAEALERVAAALEAKP